MLLFFNKSKFVNFRQNLLAICRELQNLLSIFREKSFLVMSLVKNICKDMIEQYKKDKMNNVKFDGPLSPILTSMIPLKVCKNIMQYFT
jgi:hypothetical protein